MDAPPTGRIARFLNVNSEVASLARVGPVNRQAESIMRLIRSPQTVVHLVTMLEEMPVQETLDGINELREFELPVGGIFVNRTHEPLLPTSELKAATTGAIDVTALARGLKSAGLPASDAITAGLSIEASEHAQQLAIERKLRARLRSAAAADLSAPRFRLHRRGPPVRPRRRTGRAGRRVTSLDIETLIADPATKIIVCCGSGGVGKTTLAAALGVRAAEHGTPRRHPHHRSGSTVGSITWARRARQRAAQGRGCAFAEEVRGRRAARDDARHEAHVRRDRRGARDTRESRADSGEPVLPIAVVEFCRHAGIHGDGEARAAARVRQVGSHRRRHPARAVGAGLSRRARHDSRAFSTAGSSACCLCLPRSAVADTRRSCKSGSVSSPTR